MADIIDKLIYYKMKNKYLPQNILQVIQIIPSWDQSPEKD